MGLRLTNKNLSGDTTIIVLLLCLQRGLGVGGFAGHWRDFPRGIALKKT